MYAHSRSKAVLVVLLSLALFATGCSAKWISVALADLPVLLQMALNIGTVVTTLESGQQLTSAEAAAVQNISSQASKDLNLLKTLYNQYKAAPSAGTLQKIQSAIADMNQNLPALLQASHVSDPVVASRIAAAVNLILSTVNSFATLLPQATAQAQAKTTIPHADDLKKKWNQQVCGPSGTAALDSSLAACPVK
ncbi:MAG: hypothetical protein WB952_12525 [Terriglobales bacterium]